jgi:hypothetical protein
MSPAARLGTRAVLLLAAAFAAAELGVRALDARRGFSPLARTAWFWLYEADPQLGFRGRPHASLTTPRETIHHNAEGFRDDRDLGSLPPARERRLIVCVGDAGTYGLGAGSNTQTYPAVLERELRALSGDSRFVVLNAGVPNYTTTEIAPLLEDRLLSLAPERVVAMSFKEDFEYLDLSPYEREQYRFFPLRIEGFWATSLPRVLMTSSFLGRLADKRRPARVDDFGVRRALPSHVSAGKAGARRYLQNVGRIAEAAQRAGAALLIVDQPIHYSVCAYNDDKVDEAESLRKALHDLCRERGVPVLSAHTTLDWHGLKLGDDNLLGRVGYERLAKLLAPQILALDTAAKD